MNNQIKKINFNHSFIFFLLINIFSLLFMQIENSILSPVVCLSLILIIGVSHGALDHEKGKKLLQSLKIYNMLIFYFSYILFAIAIVIFWILFPPATLIVFLIIASFHFGKEDTEFLINDNSYINQLLFFLKGSLIILAPLFFHFNETVSIFRLLLIENETFYSSLSIIEENNLLHIGIIISTISSIVLFVKNFELKKFTIFLDYFSIIIINYYFTPLIAFTIYFCFLHSVRHSISLIFELNQENLFYGFLIFVKKAIPLTALTAIICLVGLFFLNNNYDFDSAILKMIFIGLASLTFPHILLEYLIEKK